MAEKKMPDIMFDDAGPLPTYIQNGWVYPLTEFVKDDSDFERIGRYDLPQNTHIKKEVIQPPFRYFVLYCICV